MPVCITNLIVLRQLVNRKIICLVRDQYGLLSIFQKRHYCQKTEPSKSYTVWIYLGLFKTSPKNIGESCRFQALNFPAITIFLLAP